MNLKEYDLNYDDIFNEHLFDDKPVNRRLIHRIMCKRFNISMDELKGLNKRSEESAKKYGGKE